MYSLVQRIVPARIWGSTLFRFAFVGGAGFVVDSAVFAVGFYLLAVPVFPARMVSFVFAATATWLGNRIFTFNAREGSVFRQWLTFFTSACISALPNFMVFSLVVYLFGNEGYIPYAALVGGILVGMLSNYFLCKKWVFASK